MGKLKAGESRGWLVLMNNFNFTTAKTERDPA